MRPQVFPRCSSALPSFDDKAFIQSVSCLPDSRQRGKVLHPLNEILFLALCGLVCGVRGFHELETFGKEKLQWLRRFLPFANGIPSHDTLSRVVGALDPKELDSWFSCWTETLQHHVQGVLAIDGKTLRGSGDKGGKRPRHLLNAFACQDRIVLAQESVPDKSNEITGIPLLLKKLLLKGAIVTIDAMGCQKRIAKLIQKKDGDYVFGLKGNHSILHELVRDCFTQGEKDGFPSPVYACHEESDKGHGRVEKRICVCTENLTWLGKDILEQWPGLRSVVLVHSTCLRNGKEHQHRRFFLSSLPADPRKHLHAVRSHWQIENGLHHVLDVTCGEDACQVRQAQAAENLSGLRKIALNMVQLERRNRPKDSVKKLQTCAGWNNEVLESILLQPLKSTGGK